MPALSIKTQAELQSQNEFLKNYGKNNSLNHEVEKNPPKPMNFGFDYDRS